MNKKKVKKKIKKDMGGKANESKLAKIRKSSG